MWMQNELIFRIDILVNKKAVKSQGYAIGRLANTIASAIRPNTQNSRLYRLQLAWSLGYQHRPDFTRVGVRVAPCAYSDLEGGT